MIALHSVERRYRDFTLGPVTLELQSGITCLVGANGAGKSTLMQLLSGVEVPDAGKVERAEASKVGYMPQDLSFPATARVDDYLEHVAWVRNVPRQDRRTRVSELISAISLEDKAHARIRTLSGGMRRRLGLAQALIDDPDLLLLDEPTVGLDPVQRVRLRDAVKAISGNRIVIFSTHLVDDVADIADRVVILAAGTVVFDGDVAKLSAQAPDGVSLERAITSLIDQGAIA